VTPAPDPALLARYIRQKKDFGESEFFFDDLSRTEILAGLPKSGADKHARPTVPRSGAPEATPIAGSARPAQEKFDASATPPPAGQTTNVELEVLDYEGLRQAAHACRRCGLAATRNHVVFSDGNPDASLMVVGEAPGANEDATGTPFVGQAGKMLDLLLASVDLTRKDSVYICNVLKCRPPGNRNPQADEIELCSPYLKRQIALVEPAVILAVGTFSAQLLTGHNRPLGKLRGEVYSYEGVPLIVTYHPAALLRNSGWTRATWDDFQLLRQVIDR
jgi:uracil-DNA glycosylase